MLNRIDYEPVFFAPFVSSAMTARAMTARRDGERGQAESVPYGPMFDRAFDEALDLLGLGPSFAPCGDTAFQTLEADVRRLRDLPSGAPVRVTLRLVDYDDTRLHVFETLHHGVEGWTSATCERIAQNRDPASGDARPLPDKVLERVAMMRSAHAALPAPEGMGQSLGIAARS